MGIAKIKKQISLIDAYRKGIAKGIIRKQVLSDKQVVLFVKPDADEIYREAASEYRQWEIWGASAIGALQATAIFTMVAVILKGFSGEG